MHDAHGKPLKKDDLVLVPCRITQLSETEDYCNVTLQTLFGRRPDGNPELIHAINTAVLIRANDVDADNCDLSILDHASKETP